MNNAKQGERVRTEVRTSDAAAPSGAYSQGIVAGEFLFVSGQGPFDANGALVGTTFEEQATATLANISAIAQAAGGRIEDAVKIGAYLRDQGDFPTWDAVCSRTFARPFPARTTTECNLIGFDIEIDAVIWLPPTTAEGTDR
jgi:2-iminobutanoate/2-iminopropanoate deaminase